MRRYITGGIAEMAKVTAWTCWRQARQARTTALVAEGLLRKPRGGITSGRGGRNGTTILKYRDHLRWRPIR